MVPKTLTAQISSLFCLGRGPAYAISNEAALKFKETCQLHAASHSSAEVLHGPVSIVGHGFPVIALTAKDAAEDVLVQVADQISGKGVNVIATSSKATSAEPLAAIRPGHPLTDRISLISSFYSMVETVAIARGVNPDAPRHLKKVTETVQNMSLTAFIGADIHDGMTLHRNKALVLKGDAFVDICDTADLPAGCARRHLDGGILMPGFVDLQVNGGVMFNEVQSVKTLETMSRALRSVGTHAFLPTMITDTSDRTRAAIDAVEQAIAKSVPGVIGIHLEGPHLSVTRKGAHDPSLIRPMTENDITTFEDAAGRLPNILVTLAPQNASIDQVKRMADAGIIVSLGHTDADFDTCSAYIDAGASCATHLFNAMSQLGNREPGLVGATLDSGAISAGLIADAIHVHPACIRAALRAKQSPGEIFLVTDAMATIGSEITEFNLNGRKIVRRDGQLTLENGTLAGADLDFPKAISVMINKIGIEPEDVIAMCTSIPADRLTTTFGYGGFLANQPASIVYLDIKYSRIELS